MDHCKEAYKNKNQLTASFCVYNYVSFLAMPFRKQIA